MSDDQTAKVIQFPGKAKEVVETSVPATNASESSESFEPFKVAVAMPIPKPRASKANFGLGLGILAVVLASVAVNRFAYRTAAATGSRAIASANLEIDRDAAWEKILAERLAKPGSVPTAAQIGRSATLAEQMRFATLEDKYVIAFRHDGRSIAAISPAHAESKDALVIDRAEFLKKYGQLFDTTFAAADLKSVDRAAGKVTESYELRDAGGHATVRAFFELDANDQLLAVRAVQI